MPQYALIGGPAAGKFIETKEDQIIVEERPDFSFSPYAYVDDKLPETKPIKSHRYYLHRFNLIGSSRQREDVSFMVHESMASELEVYQELVRGYTALRVTERI